MLYQKEIDDSVLIQFIILYTLSKVDSAVTYDALLNLILDNCNINYNDFQVALDNLVHTEHVHAYLESERSQKYEITQKGLNAGELFHANIPIYIREPIDSSVKELFKEVRRKNAVRSAITPVRRDEYSADCQLYDDDNTQILNLSLYAGSREEAEKMAVFFREHSEDIYAKILDAFNEK
ncbi:MAG: DUF4364 family protein [Oscillospiraceae bacterium]|nr:DUF4364 family protein [Oscillospiraceae bacterium]